MKNIQNIHLSYQFIQIRILNRGSYLSVLPTYPASIQSFTSLRISLRTTFRFNEGLIANNISYGRIYCRVECELSLNPRRFLRPLYTSYPSYLNTIEYLYSRYLY